MSDTDTEEFTSEPGTTEPVEDTRPPIPVEVKPEVKQYLHNEPEKPAKYDPYNPVAVGTRVVKKPPSLTLPLVNTRASHFYFKRQLQFLRALGKYR